jgi:asparagine synthase (glutamine-hydrolysing)
MPGIVGLITRCPRERADAELQRMLGTMLHEPSYGTGAWSDEALGIYVGWTAHRGSMSDCMPLIHEQRDLTLVFSGEDFSGRGRIQALRGRDHTVGQSASYLVHLADEPEFPENLNGRFHGMLADRRAQTVTLFNDRYGMHRIYYHQAPDAFYFAAEAKAILAVRPELRSVDADGLGEFIACGCTLKNRTVFKNISVLPPASAWTFRNGALDQRSHYFDPRAWESQETLDEETYYRELREVFTRTLPRYFDTHSNPRSAVGVSLTGGLDTRMIMSWHKAMPGTLPCYSFGGMYRDSQDVQVARRVAQICGQQHETLRIDGEFLAAFPQYAERTVYLTDGCVEVRHAGDLYLNQRAEKIAPVRMTGNYGGEVLRSVRAFRPVEPTEDLFDKDFSAHLERAKETYRGLIDCHPLTFAAFRQAPWHHYGLLSLEQSQLTLRSPFLDNEFVRTVYRAPKSTLTGDAISLRLIADGSPALRRLRTDRGLGGNLPGWLESAQRNYFEFTFKAEYAYDYGMPQSVVNVDYALKAAHLEKLFLGRHKFYHFRVWYRDQLANYVRKMLLDSRSLSRPYLQRKVVEQVVRGHLKGNRNYTTALHKLLSLEHLHRLFIDSSCH